MIQKNPQQEKSEYSRAARIFRKGAYGRPKGGQTTFQKPARWEARGTPLSNLLYSTLHSPLIPESLKNSNQYRIHPTHRNPQLSHFVAPAQPMRSPNCCHWPN